SFVFFFQAEDGIRDFHVTGVQTCALPIYAGGLRQLEQANHYSSGPSLRELLDEPPPSVAVLRPWEQSIAHAPAHEGTRLSLQRGQDMAEVDDLAAAQRTRRTHHTSAAEH